MNTCAQLWKTEAIEDGRLQGESAIAYRRHLLTCAECRREASVIDSLRTRARAQVDVPGDELSRRRLRAEVLRRANGEAIGRKRPGRKYPTLLAAALALSLVTVFLIRRTHNRAPATLTVTSAVTAAKDSAPSYEVTDVAGASWRIAVEAPTTIIDLRAGRASFHVEHLPPGQRFLVELPDGELEVRGTRFVVALGDGRTDEVFVSEGVVALRLSGAPERVLTAGQNWRRQTEPALSPVLAAVPTAPATMSANAPTPKPKPALDPSSCVPSSTEARPTPPAPSAFGEAMQAFSSGAYAVADRGFADFMAQSPADARCEDAAFLRAVAHARLGDHKGAAALAKEYLARYPSGLRREEAERLAKGT